MGELIALPFLFRSCNMLLEPIFNYWGQSGYTLVTSNATSSVTFQQEEKETAMSLEQNQIDYLSRRVDDVHRELKSPLGEKFNLYKDNAPRTYKELIDAIKNDKFKLNEKRIKAMEAHAEDDEDDSWDGPYGGPFDGIIWDGPQPDEKGYKAAFDSLQKARIRALDIIKTSPAADGLKALQEFEKWTP